MPPPDETSAANSFFKGKAPYLAGAVVCCFLLLVGPSGWTKRLSPAEEHQKKEHKTMQNMTALKQTSPNASSRTREAHGPVVVTTNQNNSIRTTEATKATTEESTGEKLSLVIKTKNESASTGINASTPLVKENTWQSRWKEMNSQHQEHQNMSIGLDSSPAAMKGTRIDIVCCGIGDRVRFMEAAAVLNKINQPHPLEVHWGPCYNRSSNVFGEVFKPSPNGLIIPYQQKETDLPYAKGHSPPDHTKAFGRDSDNVFKVTPLHIQQEFRKMLMFGLTDRLMDQAKAFQNSQNWSDIPVIGLHVRTGNTFKEKNDRESGQISRRPGSKMQRNGLTAALGHYMRHVAGLADRLGISDNYQVFVLADSPNVFATLQNMTGIPRWFYRPQEYVASAHPLVFPNLRLNNGGTRCNLDWFTSPMIDLHLLSNTVGMVTSMYSGFYILAEMSMRVDNRTVCHCGRDGAHPERCTCIENGRHFDLVPSQNNSTGTPEATDTTKERAGEEQSLAVKTKNESSPAAKNSTRIDVVCCGIGDRVRFMEAAAVLNKINQTHPLEVHWGPCYNRSSNVFGEVFKPSPNGLIIPYQQKETDLPYAKGHSPPDHTKAFGMDSDNVFKVTPLHIQQEFRKMLMFGLTDRLMDQAKAFQNSQNWSDIPVIGLHVRTGNTFKEKNDRESGQISRRPGSKMQRNGLTAALGHYMRHVAGLAGRLGISDNYQVFVLADSPNVFATLQNMTGIPRWFYRPQEYVASAHPLVFPNLRLNNGGTRCNLDWFTSPMIDLHLLSNTVGMVTSMYSGFYILAEMSMRVDNRTVCHCGRDGAHPERCTCIENGLQVDLRPGNLTRQEVA